MELVITLFLNTIRMIESTNCQNTNHKVITSGIHKNMQAKGCYGIMPNTYKELKKRFPEMKYKLVYVKGKDPVVYNQEVLARYLAKHLYKKTGGDVTAMAAGWFYGHNKSKESLQSYNNSTYVNKFKSHYFTSLAGN